MPPVPNMGKVPACGGGRYTTKKEKSPHQVSMLCSLCRMPSISSRQQSETWREIKPRRNGDTVVMSFKALVLNKCEVREDKSNNSFNPINLII